MALPQTQSSFGRDREPFEPGDVLRGRVVTRLLGRGATASVYEVRDASGANFAVKVGAPRPDASACDDLLRFRRAARLCRKVRSIHIPRVHAVGVLPDGRPYMIMDRVAGTNLEHRLQGGCLDIAEAVEIGRQLLEALAVIHTAGVLHRDVKPANIMVSHGGIVRLLDFGICCPLDGDGNRDEGGESLDARASDITQEGSIVGTPHYMSPEQVRNGPLDVRADVYAAGVVLYEALTGRLPFHGTPGAVLSAILHEDVLPAALFRPELPAALERVVMRALSRHRFARYHHARMFQQQLESAARSLGYGIGPGAVRVHAQDDKNEGTVSGLDAGNAERATR